MPSQQSSKTHFPAQSVDSVCQSVQQIFTELSQMALTGSELHRDEISKPPALKEFMAQLGRRGHFQLKILLFFSFFLTSLLEYNCFTVVCQFLLYNKVNQLYIYIYPHISSLLHLPPTCISLPPSLSHPSRWSQSTQLISLCYAAASHQPSVLRLVVYISPCHSLTSSQLTLPPPHILKSILQYNLTLNSGDTQ